MNFNFGQNANQGLGANDFGFNTGILPTSSYDFGMGNTAGVSIPTYGAGGFGMPSLQVPGSTSGFGGIGFNMPTAQLGLSALGSLANLWGGFQANKLARDNFNFTKDITNTNLNNSIKSYNTNLEDRARARGAAEGQTADQIASYVDRNRMTR